MGYNFEKDTCDLCGITKKAAKTRPVSTGINHPEYGTTTSFSLGYDSSVLCAACHKERELSNLLTLFECKSGLVINTTKQKG